MSRSLTRLLSLAVSPLVFALVFLIQPTLGDPNLRVSVKDFGAKGDGITDDTGSIQKAINKVQGSGGTLVIPAGTYMIDTAYSKVGGYHGLGIRKAMTLELEAGATLQAMTSSQRDFDVLSLRGAQNVKVVGKGAISGDRSTHIGGGFGGFAIDIRGAQDITIDGVTTSNALGDGIIIRERHPNSSQNITITNVTSKNNQRQGLSIIDGKNITVKNSRFIDTGGLSPGCGIDIEPDEGFNVDGVLIEDNVLANNEGCGVSVTIATRDLGNTSVRNVRIVKNNIHGNGKRPHVWSWGSGITITNVNGVQVIDNDISANYGEGIMLGYADGGDIRTANSTIIKGNRISNTLSHANQPQLSGVGICFFSASNSVVSDNILENNAGDAICRREGPAAAVNDTSIIIRGNKISSDRKNPL